MDDNARLQKLIEHQVQLGKGIALQSKSLVNLIDKLDLLEGRIEELFELVEDIAAEIGLEVEDKESEDENE